MLQPVEYLNALKASGIDFFTGVPDSLLKHICACITDSLDEKDHIIAANEGGAGGLAIGHYLATKTVPLVYLQNSGLGNIVNPIMSLASNEVYGVPMIVLIGWRGQPGVKDEPQHVHQGRVTPTMLESMDVPYTVLSDEIEEASSQRNAAVQQAISEARPVALLVSKGTFDSYSLTTSFPELELEREDAIIKIASCAQENAAFICTTGMPSRELFEYRARTGGRHETDFLTVGGMGHASQIALGVALRQPQRPVYCIDGDGAALMHMGGLPICANYAGSNFTHIVLNNGAHESVGGQPTVGFQIDLPSVAKATGYAWASSVRSADGIEDAMQTATQVDGPTLIEVKVKVGHRDDIGRPTKTPVENKNNLMDFLST